MNNLVFKQFDGNVNIRYDNARLYSSIIASQCSSDFILPFFFLFFSSLFQFLKLNLLQQTVVHFVSAAKRIAESLQKKKKKTKTRKIFQ